jgi:hypothetical protein
MQTSGFEVQVTETHVSFGRSDGGPRVLLSHKEWLTLQQQVTKKLESLPIATSS